MQSVPAAALRSGWLSLIPVSMTATFEELASRVVVRVATLILRMPIGGTGSPAASGTTAVASTGRFLPTKATSGSLRTAASWLSDRCAAYPCSAAE